MDLCYMLAKQSRSTWNLLKRARMSGYQISEETITDLIILEAFSKYSSQIITKKFTKYIEARVGGDWEWWFMDVSKKWIGIRIQAKIINLDSGEYTHLHYQNTKTKQYQCDVLIQNSTQRRPCTLPLYCLYSNWDHKLWASSGPYRISGRMAPLFGCSFVSPFLVRNLRARHEPNHVRTLHPFMVPWEELLCFGDSSQNLAQRILNNYRGDAKIWDSRYVGSTQDDLSFAEAFNSIHDLTPLEEPPYYVSALLNRELFDEPDDNLQRVTVFRMT